MPTCFVRLLPSRLRLWVLVAAAYLLIDLSALAESLLESRYQYYQEDRDRIRVDSSYSLFSLDLNETTILSGTVLYSAISGASPSGLTPLIKGDPVPVVELEDERYAFTLGLTKQLANHAVQIGFAYSDESDYRSLAYSVQDTIAFNHKNTELVLGFAFTDDTVGANGTSLDERKISYDAIIGFNQILSKDDLLSVNFTFGYRDGYLSDPYKRVVFNEFYVLSDERPHHRFEQLLFIQWTHGFAPLHSSIETSYRYGHNDYGSDSNTFEFAYHQKLFNDRLIIRPSVRYYTQTAADFYQVEFFGEVAPRDHSADYRLSAEETVSFGVQARWWALKDRLAVDVGYDRYQTRGTDGKTRQETYPDAHSFTAGLHLQF
jgi:hypothetical protein